MQNKQNNISDFYKLDKYQIKNSTLHKEDSSWKAEKIMPLIDRIVQNSDKKIITILDVGGGAGLILSIISKYIKNKYNRKVKKIALDLSPGMLKVQAKNDPDLFLCLNEDIKKTSLAKKSIDIVLLIDVLEHLTVPEEALKEIRRISQFCIIKIPLENNFNFKVINFFDKGKLRQMLKKDLGHINVFSRKSLLCLLKQSGINVVSFEYTNVFSYLRCSEYYRGKIKGWENFINFIGSILYPLSPRLVGYLLPDYAIILVQL
jgi:SAM-dependent methyltransferase